MLLSLQPLLLLLLLWVVGLQHILRSHKAEKQHRRQQAGSKQKTEHSKDNKNNGDNGNTGHTGADDGSGSGRETNIIPARELKLPSLLICTNSREREKKQQHNKEITKLSLAHCCCVCVSSCVVVCAFARLASVYTTHNWIKAKPFPTGVFYFFAFAFRFVWVSLLQCCRWLLLWA